VNSPKQDEDKIFQGFWKFSFDDSYSMFGISVGLVFKIPQSCIYPHAIRFDFPSTNNESEYEALIQVLILVLQMKVQYLIVTGDS
jgi:hypothetical protein